jgi:uncharacterized protein YjeT (DUF2065 family)
MWRFHILPAQCQCLCLVRRVAEGLLQGLFPRDVQQQPAAAAKRFKGMLKVGGCSVGLGCVAASCISSF